MEGMTVEKMVEMLGIEKVQQLQQVLDPVILAEFDNTLVIPECTHASYIPCAKCIIQCIDQDWCNCQKCNLERRQVELHEIEKLHKAKSSKCPCQECFIKKSD